MVKQIFKTTMLCVSVAGLCLCTFVYCLFENMLYQQSKNQLQQIASMVAASYQQDPDDFGANVDKDQRISIIQQDGTVIYDSIKDISGLENHLQRSEIQQALNYGQGYAKRYSSTLHQNYLYYAGVMDNGTIIRVAVQDSSINNVLSSFIVQLIVVFIAILVLTYWLSKRLCLKIVQRINAIDIDDPYASNSFSELNPLIRRLDQQNKTISHQVNQLKQYDHEFNTIIANMDEGLVVINTDLKVLSFNDAALKLFGIENMEEGKTVYEFNGSLPFVQLIQNSQNGISSSSVLTINDRYIRLLVSPVKRNDKVSGALVLALDVSDSMNQQLLRAQFSANVSHELKTPLTSIIGFSEILANGLVESSDVESVGKDIYEQSKRLLAMVEDIIHLSKLDEASQHAFEHQQIQLASVIEEMIDQYTLFASEKEIELIYDHSDACISANLRLVKECIANLMENAIKYGRSHGHVWIKVNQSDDKVNVIIEDDGIGINEKETNRIFERFYRVDPSRNQNIKGSGLGLSIVKHSMELMNGSVSVASKLNEGSTFTLSFPK